MNQLHQLRRGSSIACAAFVLCGVFFLSADSAHAIGNLKPTAFSCSPTSGPPAASVQVEFTFYSSDRRTSPDFYVGVWYSNDDDCATAGDNTYLGQRLIEALGSETSVSDSLGVVIPPTATGATTSALCLVVDHTNLVQEVNENDNEADTPFTVTLPNLSIDPHLCPFFAAPGQVVSHHFQVENYAPEPVPGFAVDLWYSDDEDCSTTSDNIFLERIDFPSGLPANSDAIHQDLATVPPTASLGSPANLCYIVDPTDQILESNENDNTASCGFSVREVSDLAITAFSSSTSECYLNGNPALIRVDFTITNLGNVAVDSAWTQERTVLIFLSDEDQSGSFFPMIPYHFQGSYWWSQPDILLDPGESLSGWTWVDPITSPTVPGAGAYYLGAVLNQVPDDSNNFNNSAFVPLTVLESVDDLAITADDGAPAVAPGALTTYEIRVMNVGGLGITDAVVHVPLPAPSPA